MGKATRRSGINAEAGNVVIDTTGNRSKGNTLNRLPDNAICRGGHCEVIAITVLFKAAIHPDEIDFTGGVYSAGEKNVTAKVSIFGIRGYRGNGDSAAPTYAAVSRRKCHDAAFIAAADRNDDL